MIWPTKCVRASTRLIQKLTKRSVAELWDLMGRKNIEKKCQAYMADDPELLICKTNARKHAGREKNATMVKGGGGKEQTLISEFIQGQFFHIICSTHHAHTPHPI